MEGLQIGSGEKREDQLKNFRQLSKAEKKSKKSPFYTFEATAKRARLIGRIFRKAYGKDAVICWHSAIAPTEIFYALDVVPFCVESVAAMLAGANLAPCGLRAADENLYSPDICSFLRFGMGATAANIFPEPDFFLCSSYHCDSTVRMFDNLAYLYKKPLYYIDIPYHYSQGGSVDYLSSQLEKIMFSIAKLLNRHVDMEKFREVLEYSNQARNYFKEINILRRAVPSPISGGEAIDYSAMLTNTWGNKEIVDVYRTLRDELKVRVDNKIAAVPGERFRILWRHLRPYHSDNILTYVEQNCKAVVAFEEINYIYWDEIDIKKPFKSLANKLLADPAVGPVEHWINAVLEIVNDYKIEGIVSFFHWGCRHLSSVLKILDDKLKEKGIPILNLDGDCMDIRHQSEGQTKTRLDAFMELLETKYKKQEEAAKQ